MHNQVLQLLRLPDDLVIFVRYETVRSLKTANCQHYRNIWIFFPPQKQTKLTFEASIDNDVVEHHLGETNLNYSINKIKRARIIVSVLTELSQAKR